MPLIHSIGNVPRRAIRAGPYCHGRVASFGAVITR